MNILLIEDERTLALAIIRMLGHEGHRVGWQSNGSEGLAAALTGEFDLVILDLLLPSKSGWEVCREIRAADVKIPVLMLSAMDETRDKVRGLDLGADDFLAKPFEPTELLARVRALLRKNMVHTGDMIHVGDLEIDRGRRLVKRAGANVALNQTEFDILVKLAAFEGILMKPYALVHNLSLAPDPLLGPFDACMASLRAKVDGPFGAPLIHYEAGAYTLYPGTISPGVGGAG